jgi:hypothetical protein
MDKFLPGQRPPKNEIQGLLDAGSLEDLSHILSVSIPYQDICIEPQGCLNLLVFCLVLLKHLAVLTFLKNFLPVVMQEGSLPAGFPGFTYIRAIFCCFTFHYLPAGAVFIRHYKPLLLSGSDKKYLLSC